jgi:hypothetical protein
MESRIIIRFFHFFPLSSDLGNGRIATAAKKLGLPSRIIIVGYHK